MQLPKNFPDDSRGKFSDVKISELLTLHQKI